MTTDQRRAAIKLSLIEAAGLPVPVATFMQRFNKPRPTIISDMRAIGATEHPAGGWVYAPTADDIAMAKAVLKRLTTPPAPAQ